MLNKMPEDEPPEGQISPRPSFIATHEIRVKNGPVAWLKTFMRGKTASNANNIQEALEDLIEELEDSDESQIVVDNQKTLITNVLKTHDLRVSDVMVPRADIVAVEEDITLDELRDVFKGNQFSRIPVYRENLDNIIGVLHIKDLLTCLLEKRDCQVSSLIRDVIVVPPGIPLMDLFLTLREDKKHMAVVVDEHGGIDGLVTINDIVEAVMGDIEDEFDNDEQPQIIEKSDGSLVVDARFEIDDFEERYGSFLTTEEREDVETLGGLAFSLAGHVPTKGEVLKHSTGMTIEVMDANASRVKRIRIRYMPKNISESDEV
jgi:CBS domain containing-hemolysin-like protein